MVGQQRKEAAAEAGAEALYLLDAASREQERIIEATAQLLRLTSLLFSASNPDPSSFASHLVELLRHTPWLANVGLHDLQGRLLASAVPPIVPVNASDRLYFQRALKNRGLAIGEYAVSRTTGKPVLHIGYPAWDGEGRLVGVLWAAIDLTWLGSTYVQAPLPAGAVFTLVDRQGLVLYRFPPQEGLIGQPADLPFQELLSGEEETAVWARGSDGRRRLYVFRPLLNTPESGGVFACLSLEADTVYASVNRLLFRSAATTLLATLLLVLLLFSTGCGVLLYRHARRKIWKTEEKYRAIFENTGTATIIVREDNIISLANEEFARLVGYTRGEIEEKLSWKEFVADEEDLRRMEEYHRLRREKPEQAPKNYETKIRDRDGKIKYVYLTVDLIPGSKESVASFLDLTERKQSYELQRALAQENARLYREARERLDQLQTLRAIDLAIMSRPDLASVLEVVLGQVKERFKADAAAILLSAPDGRSFIYVAGKGFDCEIQGIEVGWEESGAGMVAEKREMVHIPDLRECRSKFRWPWQTDLENFASYTGVPLVFKDRLMGVLEFFYREPPCAPEYWAGFLETLAGQIAIALDNARLWEDLRNSHKELSQAYDATIEALVYAVDLRDKETEGHSRRVADLTVALGRMLGIKEEGLVHIRRGALLHDIGKLGVPDSILHKPGPLSEEEWVLMRRHPIYAYEMLWPIAHLRPALDIPYC
ncbi:MAG: PAS domain S-box protein, partial [Moorellaceae bacterium]